MRILHLAYEDPAQPGSGGGSVRTREINRRLATRHSITAITSGYKGARPRIEDGIHWIPIGTLLGTRVGRLSYFALLGWTIRQHKFDLLVEDFGAPFSVGFAPLFTRKPVIASVQWLFAKQMREKYHLPFDWVERMGLSLYHDFISVSDWLSRDITARSSNTPHVETIPNGVDSLAFAVEPDRPQHLVFLGRLDIQQKGCDLLLDIFAIVHRTLGAQTPRLLIIGDGEDRLYLEQKVQQLGLFEVVTFCGRVEGIEKYRLLATAYAVLMPSRFETFGMVAAEGQAAGAPIITFDVGPLAEVVGGGGARLVSPFDLETFAQETVMLIQNEQLFDEIRTLGRNWAKRYDWDQIAVQQEQHYLRTLGLIEAPHKPISG